MPPTGRTLAAVLLLFFASPGGAIECFRCKSNTNIDCSERIDPTLLSRLQPEPCDDIFEAQYCVKTTGMYQGEIGTHRFCSSRDHGEYCEYVRRPGDDREYRSCIYTCDADACNGTSYPSRPVLALSLALAAGYLAAKYLTVAYR